MTAPLWVTKPASWAGSLETDALLLVAGVVIGIVLIVVLLVVVKLP